MSYRRHFDADGEDSLARLARWVRPGSAVLELGAATGYFTRHLGFLGCTVDLVEIDSDAAAEAASFARRTVVADLDDDAWPAQLAGERYDAIVCADVLEHLRDGPTLLRRLHPLLAEGGELLLSVPNVAHSALIARLVDDRFDYGGEGLLDATHRRLYTWRSLAQVLHEAGYRVEEWQATTLAGYETEFRVSDQALAAPLADALAQRPHALVYQWLVRAVPGKASHPLVPPAAPHAPSIPVRLLQAADLPHLTLEHAATLPLPVGGAATALDWRLEPGTRALRLLLADRPGVIDVRALALCSGNEVLWTYDGDPARLRHGLDVVPLDGPRYALAADGAWIEPDVPAETIARADRLSATLAWSTDFAEAGGHAAFTALAAVLGGENAAWRKRRDELIAMIEARDTQLAVMYREEARLKEELTAEHEECVRREKALAAQERIIAYRQSLVWWLKLPFVRALLAWRKVGGR